MMRKFPKLLAVVLAIAIIICPAMCLTSMAETLANDYTVSYADDVVTVKVDAANGFLVALLRLDVKGFNVNEAGIEVTETTPAIENGFAANPDFNADAGVLSLLLAAKDADNINVVTSATVKIPVTKTAAEGEEYNITLTTIQAADAGSVVNGVLVAEDFIDFPYVADAEDGTIADAPEDKAVAVNGVQHVCKVVEYVDNGDGTHDGICDCDAQTPVVDNEAHEYDDDADIDCNKCGYEREIATECQHENATSEVTLQPTKDAVGTMTYTCDCGETWTEEIAKPINHNDLVMFSHELSFSSVVADAISVSNKHILEKIGADYTYFVVIEYQKYGNGHVLEEYVEPVVLTAADKDDTSTTNKHCFKFRNIALYEMTLDFTATLYFVNGDGIVDGYETRTMCIADIALEYCNKYGASMPTLKTAMADMCRYGDEIQKFFTKASPDGDIKDARLPSTILGETYMACASPLDDVPAAGSYNNTNNDKILADGIESTQFVSTSKTLSIGATNQIYYRIRHDEYALEDIEIKVSFYDPLYDTTKVFTVDKNNPEILIDEGPTKAGYTKYKYYFTDLVLYAVDETVTMDMYYKGNLELTSTYSLGNFANTYMSDANYKDFIVAMELFSNSIGIQLGLDPRW